MIRRAAMTVRLRIETRTREPLGPPTGVGAELPDKIRLEPGGKALALERDRG
jgi:hypothetical protein